MPRSDQPADPRDCQAKHARLFELIRQQNLIATRRVGRKARPLERPVAAALLAAADASLLGGTASM